MLYTPVAANKRGTNGATSMKGANRERWHNLCEQAAIEQDPERLLELIKEINQLLEEKEQRLKQERHVTTHGAA